MAAAIPAMSKKALETVERMKIWHRHLKCTNYKIPARLKCHFLQYSTYRILWLPFCDKITQNRVLWLFFKCPKCQINTLEFSPSDNYRPATIFWPCPEVVIISDKYCNVIFFSPYLWMSAFDRSCPIAHQGWGPQKGSPPSWQNTIALDFFCHQN